MNCALCKNDLKHMSVMCFDLEKGGCFNICFDCTRSYFEKYPGKDIDDIAMRISIDLKEKYRELL